MFLERSEIELGVDEVKDKSEWEEETRGQERGRNISSTPKRRKERREEEKSKQLLDQVIFM